MRQAEATAYLTLHHYFASGHPGDGDGNATPKRNDLDHGEQTLPYRVELWDQTKTFVEQVLAVTAHGSVGFAAYYAAARELPGRYITLRHKGGVIARSNGPAR